MVGPVVSARMIFWPPMPSLGRIAMVSTSTPMPPSQWVNERQNRMPLGRCSISVRMVDPVVVKPEAVSKYASARLGMAPDSTKGRAPISDIASQLTPTMKKPSRMRRSSDFWLGIARSTIWPTRMTGRLHSRKMRNTSHSL